MALTQGDMDSIATLISANNEQLMVDIDNRVNRAQFGGPTVQVAPTDLVYLGNGQYVSESKGRVYAKSNGRLIDMGAIPEPV